MMTLYHAPQSRSSRIVTLLDELGAADKVTIREVSIRRALQGFGERDPANPHPEGKVPFLIDGPATIRESGAIMLYLTEKFPQAGLGVAPGHPDRGRFLSWMFYYGSVLEPVVMFERLEIAHPRLHDTYRGMHEMLSAIGRALETRPYLATDRFTAADLLISSTFAWFPDALPEVPAIQDWNARCQARPALARTRERDAAAMTRFAA